MRAFLAVELSKPIRRKLALFQRQLRALPISVTWVAERNLHITVKFLGEVTAHRLSELKSRLEPDYAEREPFTVHIGGFGAYPNLRKPHILWAGANGSEDAFQAVFEQAERAAGVLGVAQEPRAFSPHITLGRIRNGGEVRGAEGLLAPYAEFDAGDMTVSSVSLFSSQLTPKGSIYNRLSRFPFACPTSSTPPTVS